MAQYQPMITIPSREVGSEVGFSLSLPRIREEVLVSGQLGNQSFTSKCVSKVDGQRSSSLIPLYCGNVLKIRLSAGCVALSGSVASEK